MPCFKTTFQFQLYSGEMMPPNYIKKVYLLGLFLTPNSLLYLLALPLKSVPVSSSVTQGPAALPLAPDLDLNRNSTTLLTVWYSVSYFTCA